MKNLFSKNKIISSAISPFNQYCTGYPGVKNYITALVLGIGSFKKTFSHPGSNLLDSIMAYDKAETDSAYLGQINMSIVSSFCGPQGLIWGHDIVKEEGFNLPSFFSAKKLGLDKKIKIRSGKNLRKAALALLGSNEERHFPLLPGTHTPCAGKFLYKEGPCQIYAANAIGIPENRNKSACLFMEDVGEIIGNKKETEEQKGEIFAGAVKSVLAIGKNQNILYKEIYVDLITREIPVNQMGCALVAIPYLLLAQNAITENLENINLKNWVEKTKKYFLSNQ